MSFKDYKIKKSINMLLNLNHTTRTISYEMAETHDFGIFFMKIVRNRTKGNFFMKKSYEIVRNGRNGHFFMKKSYKIVRNGRNGHFFMKKSYKIVRNGLLLKKILNLSKRPSRKAERYNKEKSLV